MKFELFLDPTIVNHKIVGRKFIKQQVWTLKFIKRNNENLLVNLMQTGMCTMINSQLFSTCGNHFLIYKICNWTIQHPIHCEYIKYNSNLFIRIQIYAPCRSSRICRYIHILLNIISDTYIGRIIYNSKRWEKKNRQIERKFSI